MSVGSFAKFVGSGTDSTTLQTARNTWAVWDFPGSTGWVETDADGLVSESGSDFTIGETGRYLILWRIRHTSSHNNYLTMKSKLVSAGADVEGAETFGRSRNSGNNSAYHNGQCLFDATSGDVIGIEYLVDVSAGTEAGAWDADYISITFIRLTDSADTAYATYTDSAETQSFGGTTWLDVDWNTIEEETDTAVIQRNADGEGIDIKGAIGDRFLLVCAIAIDQTSNSRTQRIMRFTLDTVEQDCCRSYAYIRNTANGTCNLNMMSIIEKLSNSDEVVHVQVQRGTADGDGTVARVINRSRFDVMKIHADTELIKTGDATAAQDLDGAGTALDINGARAIDFSDTASFTAPAITDINCVLAVNVLFWSNIFGTRSAASGARLSRRAEPELAGTNLTYGTHGTYARGNQGSTDTLDMSFHPYAVELVTAGQDFQVEVLDDGEDGGTNDALTIADRVGFFAINLNTLLPDVTASFSTASGQAVIIA